MRACPSVPWKVILSRGFTAGPCLCSIPAGHLHPDSYLHDSGQHPLGPGFFAWPQTCLIAADGLHLTLIPPGHPSPPALLSWLHSWLLFPCRAANSCCSLTPAWNRRLVTCLNINTDKSRSHLWFLHSSNFPTASLRPLSMPTHY